MAKRTVKVAVDLSTKLHEAVAAAESFANKSGLPQTVFLDAEHGWMHTNPLAGCLYRAKELHVTMLNSNYFN